jgi:hypothetical protein
VEEAMELAKERKKQLKKAYLASQKAEHEEHRREALNRHGMVTPTSVTGRLPAIAGSMLLSLVASTSCVVCPLAAFLLYKNGSKLFVPSLINAIVDFWSLGIMHNYGRESGISDNYERLVISLNMITSGCD